MREKKVRDVGNAITADEIVEDCASLVRRACLPVEPGEHTAPQIDRAARRLGITPYQAKRLWYRERRDISAHEYINLHRRIEAMQKRAAAAEGEIDAIRERLARAGIGRDRRKADPVGSVVCPNCGTADT